MGCVRSGQSVQPDVTTNVKTPFGLRLEAIAEGYAVAVMTQQHMTHMYRENVTYLLVNPSCSLVGHDG